MIRRIALAAAVVAAAAGCAAARAGPPSLKPLFEAKDWLNGRLGPADVRGKVVLLDFYTFGCINCKNVEPNLRSLYRNKSRSDLVIISVHSPETLWERSQRNLIESMKEQGVAWPVVVDNDFQVWNNFGVAAWPTEILFDRHGVARTTIVGDSQDQALDAAVDKLIAQPG